MSCNNEIREFSSFRDPSGCIFWRDGELYRQINKVYEPQYTHLMNCGLYEDLRRFNAIISHEQADGIAGISEECALVIRPERIPFISYPYEWSFGQMKDAALLTLKLHRRAMRYNMVLKDASAYNIQFLTGNAVLIDTLSFDFYEEGAVWGAYGQFCRHFLAPLLLMSEVDIRLNRLLSLYIDGVPIDLAAALLKGRGGMVARQHIQWHAKSLGKHSEDGKKEKDYIESTLKQMPRKHHLALIESLIKSIEQMVPPKIETEWGGYYSNTNYTNAAEQSKATIVREYLDKCNPRTVWDLGANNGTYSKLALDAGSQVVAFDIDPAAVESNYSYVKKEGAAMLPLVLDLTNPSPGIGFANRERKALPHRQKPDCIMALALIHHLAISNNLPLDMISSWLSEMTKYLIIEFVPKEDSQVKLLLATRRDIFPDYTQVGFERAFSKHFILKDVKQVRESSRTLYLWEVK